RTGDRRGRLVLVHQALSGCFGVFALVDQVAIRVVGIKRGGEENGIGASGDAIVRKSIWP
ncbi:hypothetical protein, partial [Dyella jejuensis]